MAKVKHWLMLFETKLGKRTMETANFILLSSCFLFECGQEGGDRELRNEGLLMCKRATALFNQMLGNSAHGCSEAHILCGTLHLRAADWLASAEHFLCALSTEDVSVASSQTEYSIAKANVGAGQAFAGFGNYDAAVHCFEQAVSAMSMVQHRDHPESIKMQAHLTRNMVLRNSRNMSPSPTYDARMMFSNPKACKFLIRFQRPGPEPSQARARAKPGLCSELIKRGRFQRRRKHCTYVNRGVSWHNRHKRNAVLEVKRGLAPKAGLSRRLFTTSMNGLAGQVPVQFPTPLGLSWEAQLSSNTVTVTRVEENGPAGILVNINRDGKNHQEAFTVSWFHGQETTAKNNDRLHFVNVSERMSGVEQVGLWCRLNDGSVFQNPLTDVDVTPKPARVCKKRWIHVPFPAQWQEFPWQCRLFKSSWLPILHNPRFVSLSQPGNHMLQVLGLSLHPKYLNSDSKAAADKSKKWACLRVSSICQQRLKFIFRRPQFIAGTLPRKASPQLNVDILLKEFPLPMNTHIVDSQWMSMLSQLPDTKSAVKNRINCPF
jgi:hypothetical protein